MPTSTLLCPPLIVALQYAVRYGEPPISSDAIPVGARRQPRHTTQCFGEECGLYYYAEEDPVYTCPPLRVTVVLVLGIPSFPHGCNSRENEAAAFNLDRGFPVERVLCAGCKHLVLGFIAEICTASWGALSAALFQKAALNCARQAS